MTNDSMARVHDCAVEGCDGLALDGRYCTRCMEEIKALARMSALADKRRERKAARQSTTGFCGVVYRRLWVLDLAVVIICGLYVLAAGVDALLQWLGVLR